MPAIATQVGAPAIFLASVFAGYARADALHAAVPAVFAAGLVKAGV